MADGGAGRGGGRAGMAVPDAGGVGKAGRRRPGPVAGAPLSAARREAIDQMRSGRRWSQAKEDIFFDELAQTANVRHSAEAAGMTPVSANRRRRSHPAFDARWIAALAEGYAVLETLLLNQALEGAERTETVRDADGTVKQQKVVRSFPTAVAMRLLQAHREQVERHRLAEVLHRTGQGAGGQAGDAAIVERVRAELVRVRLLRAGSSPDGPVPAGSSDASSPDSPAPDPARAGAASMPSPVPPLLTDDGDG